MVSLPESIFTPPFSQLAPAGSVEALVSVSAAEFMKKQLTSVSGSSDVFVNETLPVRLSIEKVSVIAGQNIFTICPSGISSATEYVPSFTTHAADSLSPRANSGVRPQNSVSGNPVDTNENSSSCPEGIVSLVMTTGAGPNSNAPESQRGLHGRG